MNRCINCERLGFRCPMCLLRSVRGQKSTAPPCKDCGDSMCQAFRERTLPGRSSYACALRQVEKLRARVRELEADPGRLTHCGDCGCEIMVSAAFCQRCSGVEATDA